MALPMILSLLGSGLAGAGALGAMSPLLAGAIGAGAGSAIETGDIGEGIKTGLFSGLLGGIGGSLTGGAAGEGIMGGLRGLPTGMEAVAKPAMAQAPAVPFGQMMQSGLKQGVMTGAGLGTALGGMAMTQPPSFGEEEYEDIPQAAPANRRYMAPPPGYRPGIDPEHMYFSPSIIGAQRFAQGGMVDYQPAGMEAVPMQAGGLADMAAAQGMATPRQPQMNEKELVSAAISAVREELPEQTAAIVLAQFVQTFGEDALRRLVDDVRSGRVDGAGDGMDDLVPAKMRDGEGDVLLSRDEYVVDAPTVAMLGNGSSEAGAKALDDMRRKVRMASIGSEKQPNRINPEEVLPA